MQNPISDYQFSKQRLASLETEMSSRSPKGGRGWLLVSKLGMSMLVLVSVLIALAAI